MLNIAIMTGRLVADPEITVVGANQNQKCAFRIAVPRRFKTENGPDSDFILSLIHISLQNGKHGLQIRQQTACGYLLPIPPSLKRASISICSRHSFSIM